MALLDKGLKQRIVGALVLLALAVIFVPMLLSGKGQQHVVEVQVPPMPEPEALSESIVESLQTSDLQAAEPILAEAEDQWQVVPEPVAPEPVAAPKSVAPKQAAPAVTAAPVSRLDDQHLPISWSIQLASMSNAANAQNLQDTLRAQGHKAYVRRAQGMQRVFVGPFIERSAAEQVKAQINQKLRLNGFVVRFEPER